MILVHEDIKTGILTLKIDASEPELAAEINKVFIEKLDSHQRKYNKLKQVIQNDLSKSALLMQKKN